MLTQSLRKGLSFTLNAGSPEQGAWSRLEKNGEALLLHYYFAFPLCPLQAEAQEPYSQLTLHMTADYLHAFPLSLHQIGPVRDMPLCNESLQLLQDILQCPHEDPWRLLYLESKVLALLCCFQRCARPAHGDCRACKFLLLETEKEKIVAARDLLLTRLQEPPTIPELALYTGINQCYLKKGFKELYGSTIYDFIQEQRMLKASVLLRTLQPVSQVAEEVGFSSVSSFSRAFRKRTGLFPREVNRMEQKSHV